MFLLHSKINENYAWELSGLHMLRQFSDGVDFFEFHINWDRYLADHTPSFQIMLVILNFTIFEFNIYYVWHRDESTCMREVIDNSQPINKIGTVHF